MKLKAVAHSATCDIAGCRSDWDVRLSEGSSLLNPGKSVKLCDVDLKRWLEAESLLRATFMGRENPHNEARKAL